MKLQKFIDILNQKKKIAGDFFEKHGTNIFTTDKLLSALLAEKWSEHKYFKLSSLGEIIRFDLGRKCEKKKFYFDNMLPMYCYFADYINCGCTFFSSKLIPFEEWEDLAKEQVDNLKILVEKKQLKSYRRTKIFREFGEKCSKRTDLFEKKGYLNEHDFIFPSGI